MSVAAFVTNRKDAQSLIPWAARFAHAANAELLIVAPKKSKGKKSWNDITANSESSESLLLTEVFSQIDALDSSLFEVGKEQDENASDKTSISVREIESPDPEAAFAEEMMDLDVRLLLIPAREPTRNPSDEQNWIYKLLIEAPCQTMIVRGIPEPDGDESPLKIVVATDGEPDTDIALSRAEQLAEKFGGELSLLYVRPDDDQFAMHVARYQLERLDKNVRVNLTEIPKTIVLQENLRTAIKNHCEKNGPDLVVVGTRNVHKVKNLMRPWDSTDLTTNVALVRDGVPFSSRLINEVRLWIRSRVPQMNREQRVKLVDRLNLNSNFDFDFVALIVLSTLIAALGLVQNSGAVVIGAMLVAPLMTPLVGIGFSLVQGNERLVQTSVRSVLLGFAVAFAMGLVLGLILNFGMLTGLLFQGIDIENAQLQARGHPTLLDWFVAFISGIAAAYAIGRPNLLSALPGVAIAAALVPPIATSGLALSVLDLELWFGALLLFFTNIVAIALGTAVAFWCVGVDSRAVAKKKEGKQAITWPRYYFLVFVLLSFILAGAMSLRNRRPAAQIEIQQATPATDTKNQ